MASSGLSTAAFGGFRIALVAIVAGFLASTARPCSARVPLTDLPPSQTGIGSNVACVIEAARAGDAEEYLRCALNGRAAMDGDRLQVQVHLAQGFAPADLVPLVEAAGGRVGIMGIDLLNAWLPLIAIERFAGEPAVTFVQMPQRPVEWTGKVQGQGGELLRTPRVSCTGADGYGQTVAVVDTGFTDLDKSKQNHEVYKLVGKTSFKGGTHGTMCAEVVAEVAPRATLYPVRAGSMAAMQHFIGELVGGNPHHVGIVSHSVGWMGLSFGRHTGPLCALTDKARNAGVAWVNASGNNGGGNFYAAPFTDADGDGNHEVLPGEPKLLFRAYHHADLQFYFDWDDYEKHTIDLDLYLFRREKGFFKQINKSAKGHTGFTGTSEYINMPDQPAGVYALVIARGKFGSPPGHVRMRLLNRSTRTTTLSVSSNNNNVYDPANCKNVLAVGALRYNRYEKGPLESYSSYGPTPDGRVKPELVAPTGVLTSKGWFFGTSAACPHAAGALAAYASATPATALELVDRLIEDAEPMGVEHPDEAYGYGRLRLNPERLGWQCDHDSPELPAPCTTLCETIGRRGCTASCRWNKCVPPWESCNGIDDDCDGFTDEEAECRDGADVERGADGDRSGAVDGGADGDGAAEPQARDRAEVDGGCATERPAGGAPWWLVVLLLSGPAVLRTRRSAECRCPPSSSRCSRSI